MITSAVTFGSHNYYLASSQGSGSASVGTTTLYVTTTTSPSLSQTITISTSDSGISTSNSGHCLSLAIMSSSSGTNSLIVGCTARLVTITIGSDGFLSAGTISSTSVGTGVFHSVYYHASMDMIYGGTHSGFSFAIDASTFRIKKLLYNTITAGDPITAIWVDEDLTSGVYPRQPVIFWASQTGAVFRTNTNSTSFAVTASSSITGTANTMGATQFIPIGDYLYMPTPTVAASSGTKAFAIYKAKKSSCSSYGCSACMADPYCGWCYSSNTCSEPASCASAEYSFTSGTCPSFQYISPSSGSVVGGTDVAVYGSFYRVNSTYQCLWTITPSGQSASAFLRNATSVTSSSIICSSPPAPTGSSYTVNLDINYVNTTGTAVSWMSSITSFKYYNCSSLSCSSCTATSSSTVSTVNVQYKECGWCVMSASCTTKASCTTPSASLALVDSTLGWTTSSSPCPSSSSITPSSISITSTAALSVAVKNFPATSSATGAFTCNFALSSNPSTTLNTPATGVSNASSTSYFSSFQCAIPTTSQASFGSTSNVLVSITTATTTPSSSANTAVTVGSGIALNIYSCTDFTRCDQCISTTHPECGWCASTKTCGYTASTTCAAATTCPSLTSISPNSTQVYSAHGLALSLAGTQLSDSASLTCLFQSLANSATSLSTSVTSNTATLVSCSTPTDVSFTTGLWDVSVASSGVSLMNPIVFSVYDCSALNTCQTCVTDHSYECNWCSTPGGVTCSNSTATACARRITLASGNSTCPIITVLDPTYVVVSKASNVQVAGTGFDLTSTNVADLSCAYSTNNESTISTVTASYVDNATVSCQAVNIAQTGSADFFLIDSVTNNEFSTLATLDIQTCADITNCTQCISYGCVLCWGQCATTCSDSLGQQSVCPIVDSVSPSYSDIDNPVTITITGSNFIAFTSSSTKRSTVDQFDESILAIVDGLQSQASENVVLTLPKGDFDEIVEENKRGAMAVSGYQCYFGTQVTSGTWINSDSIQCASPSGGVDRDVELIVYVNGGAYFSAQTGYSLFACPNTIQTDACYDSCTANLHCGWCASSQSCTSETICAAPSIWQETCNVATLSQNLSGVTGGEALFVNMSNALPAYTTRSDLLCSFGEATAAISSFFPNTTGTEITSVECEIPPSPDTTGASVSFSVTYQNDRVTTVSTFNYVECSQYKSCTKCSVQTGCGWCNTNNKCTMQSACSASKWTKTHCPVSKLALGLGIGLGLLFLVVLAALIGFLIYRGNRKRGLLIRMREPNYDAIAWGIDSALQFRVPSHKYAVLERALCRKDHLLQLALSLTCPATEQEMLAKGLVFVAVYHKFAPEMIQTVIRAEVASCLEENTLFRSNSVASKMYKFYSRIVGIKYLYHCIARVIMELEVLGQKSMTAAEKESADVEAGKGSGSNSVSLLQVTMELDTDIDVVADGNMDTDTNLLQLQLICQKILAVLTRKALKDIPSPLRSIFIEIDRSVSAKFPGSIDAVYKGLGGLYFLRFVCPAITAPHVYGLLERPPNGATQRQLVLIGKVIQSIANMSPPGRKEPYMEVMGNFIVQAIPRIRDFYDNLRQASNVDSEATTYDREIVVPEEVLLNGLAATQVVLVGEHEKIKTWSQTSYLDQETRVELCTIIDECMADDNTAPKKQKKESAGPSSKRKK